jgi:hypothetical protein
MTSLGLSWFNLRLLRCPRNFSATGRTSAVAVGCPCNRDDRSDRRQLGEALLSASVQLLAVDHVHDELAFSFDQMLNTLRIE